MNTTPETKTPRRAQRENSSKNLRRLAGLFLFGLVGLAASIWAVIWWNDRPLAAIDRQIESREYLQAIRAIRVEERERPESARLQVLKAEALAGLGDWPSAVAIFDNIGSDTTRSHRAYATALLHLSQWSRAEGVLVLLLGEIGDEEDALHELTVCRMKLGRYPDALESAKRAAALPGNQARGNVLIGEIHRVQKNVDSAITAWTKVIEDRPDAEDLQVTPAEFFAMYGGVLLEGGKPEAAREMLKRSVAIQPAAEPLVDLGKAYLLSGEKPQAVAAWNRALEFEHLNRTAREELANAALSRGAAREAIDVLEPLLDAGVETSATAYQMQRAHLMLKESELAQKWQKRGEVLRKQEKTKAAIEHILIEAPRSFWSRFILAHRFASAGNWPEAEILATGLLREDENDPLVRDLAKAIQERGKLPSLDRLPIEQF